MKKNGLKNMIKAMLGATAIAFLSMWIFDGTKMEGLIFYWVLYLDFVK